MMYAAVAVAILGFILGLKFRLRLVLGIIVLLFACSLVYCFSYDAPLFDKILIVLGPQGILQSSYFLGLLSRNVFSAFAQRKLSSAPEQQAQDS